MNAPAPSPADTVATIPGPEDCPGQFIWSAFGAMYSDTACSNGTLLDLDSEHLSDIPCPMCNPTVFTDWAWPNGPLRRYEDGTPVEADLPTHFHDGPGLWFSATHPTLGEQRIMIRDNDGDDDE